MRWLPVLAIVLSGCLAPRRYTIWRPGLTCNRATRVALRTMREIGYTVTELIPAEPFHPGLVVGTKPGANGAVAGRVRIVCRSDGVEIQPIEEALWPNYEFSRLFGYSFGSLVQRPDVEEPTGQVGLQILVHSLDRSESRLDLGGVATAGDAVLVRVTIRNATDRVVRLDPRDVELVTDAGQSARPLTEPALGAALTTGAGAERVRAGALRRAPVAPRTTVTGFLVYPPGRYREARLALEDVETGETDGFVAPVE